MSHFVNTANEVNFQAIPLEFFVLRIGNSFLYINWSSFSNNNQIYWVGLTWSCAEHYLAFGIVFDMFV